MALPSFDILADSNPELKPAIQKLSQWTRHHSDWDILDPRKLSRDLLDVEPIKLALALNALVRAGLYRQVFVVATPDGDLVEGEYDDPGEIPSELRDNFNHPFDVDDGEVVPILKPLA